MNPSPLLSPVQRRIAGAALTLLAVLGIAALLGLGVVALGRLLAHFSSVLWPLATAGVLALMLRPWVGWLEARLRVSRLGAVIILYALFTGIVAGALLLAAPAILGQIVDLVTYLPKLAEKLSGYVQASYPEWKALADREVGLPLWSQLVEKAVEEAKGLLAHAWPSLRTAVGGGLRRRNLPDRRSRRARLPLLFPPRCRVLHPRARRTPPVPLPNDARGRGLPRR